MLLTATERYFSIRRKVGTLGLMLIIFVIAVHLRLTLLLAQVREKL